MVENYLNIPDKVIVGIRGTQGFVTYKRNDGKIAKEFWVTRKLIYDGISQEDYINKKENEWMKKNHKFFGYNSKEDIEEFKKIAKREVFVYRGDVYSIKENMIVKDYLAYADTSYNSRRDVNYTEFKAKDFLEKYKDSNLYLTKRSKSTENKLKAVTDNNYEFKFDEYY